MRSAEFDTALCAQPPGIDLREAEFGQPLTSKNATSHAPSPMHGLKRKKVRGKTGPQCRKHRRPAQPAPKSTLENEHYGRRRHVTVAAKHLTLIAQGTLLQFKCDFDCVEHFRAAGVA